MKLLEVFESGKSMDIIKVLKKEHDEVDALFAQIEKARGSGKKQKLFQELNQSLYSHAEAEQDVLYTALTRHRQTKKDALEGFQEHAIIEYLLRKLSHMNASQGDLWEAILKVLRENVEHHVKEEEKVMFSHVKKVFSKEEREQLGREFMRKKRNLSGPRLPYVRKRENQRILVRAQNA